MLAETKGQFLSKELRLLDRYELQDELVGTLKATRWHSELAARVAACHTKFRHWRCEHDHNWAEAENSCGCRLCPHDQRRRSMTLVHRFEPFLAGRGSLRYIVFAERNCVDLREGIRSLFAAWDRVRRGSFWKNLVTGAIVALEITYNREQKTFHPHLNVLFEGEFIPFADLNAVWVEATRGNGHTSHIQKADPGTTAELLKYVTKVSDLIGQPAAVDHFLTATERRRFVRTYGVFFRIPVSEDQNERCCPDCKTSRVLRMESLWPWQLSLDLAGVFRVSTIVCARERPRGSVFDRGG